MRSGRGWLAGRGAGGRASGDGPVGPAALSLADEFLRLFLFVLEPVGGVLGEQVRLLLFQDLLFDLLLRWKRDVG